MGGQYASNFDMFAKSVHGAYGKRMYEKNAWWLSPHVVKSYIRSLRVTHGSELMNTINLPRKCQCQVPLDEVQRCVHQEVAVRKGVEYILEAEDDQFEDTFLRELYKSVLL